MQMQSTPTNLVAATNARTWSSKQCQAVGHFCVQLAITAESGSWPFLHAAGQNRLEGTHLGRHGQAGDQETHSGGCSMQMQSTPTDLIAMTNART